MQVWRAFDNLMFEYTKNGNVVPDMILEAHKYFQLAPFVFPPDIDRYLTKLTRRMWRQFLNQNRIVQQRWEGLMVRGLHREQVKCLNLMKWLGNQQREGKKLFQQHMSLID